jgi:putative membrane-bound dehydrogenase-like protein
LINVALAIVLLGQQPAGAFPEPYDSEPGNLKPMSAEEAAKSFRMPEGFRVSVAAVEPDVRNPIACAWDERGRLWVAENYTYAERAKRFDMNLRDRVLIFDGLDEQGKFTKRSVFTDDVQCLTSVEVGHGGVWLMCPPQLLFVPMRDDKPSGPAEVVLDGFTVPPENYHNFANGLRWGPDGWLYGRCGASSPGEIGAPGTPADQRIPLRGGLWRYHPRRKAFESLASGTTNPWGHDWDDKGEAFFINTVNGHLWHAVAGMHFVRPHTIDPNPRVYQLIDQHADHFHWDTAKDWSDSKNLGKEHDIKGGGHAHSGLIIYDGQNWPEAYRGKMLTLNLHGRRINMDRLERQGSGYVGKHEPDPIFVGDPWFRGIDLTVGPDGAVYVLDWSDTGECHENTGVHRTSGRIYRITCGEATPRGPIDLGRRSDVELIGLASHENAWTRKQVRRLLTERVPASPRVRQQVKQRLDEARSGRLSDREVLDVLWVVQCLDLVAEERAAVSGLLDHKDESVRAWTIRLLTDHMPLDTVMSRRPRPDTHQDLDPDLLKALLGRALTDQSGLVRLVLASMLQRLPHEARFFLASTLTARSANDRSQDADDHNLPMLVWYGLMPLAETSPGVLGQFTSTCSWPTTNRLVARALAESVRERPRPVNDLVHQLNSTMAQDPKMVNAVLAGVAEGLKGYRKAPRPEGWDEVTRRFGSSEDPGIRDRVRELGVVFGDGRALDEVRRLALDDKADLELRRSALLSLIEARPDDLRPICERLLKVRFLNTTAVRGLALFDDPAIGKALAENYRSFHPSERGAVLDTLVSRPGFARALLDQMAVGRVPREDLGAFRARQVRGLNQDELFRRLAEVWGELRDTDADKKAAIQGWKQKLSPESLTQADKGRGRQVFDKICATCHVLYGQGKTIGPDLTGSGRDDLDYILENVLDPSAVVTADYRMVVVAAEDGRVFNGIVKARNDRTMTLQTQNEEVTLDRSSIAEERPSTASLMPDGLWKDLSEAEVRDLVAYLQGRTQVPLP